MKCEVFERRLQELLDERKAPGDDRVLRAHADACSDCKHTLVAQEMLFQGLDAFDAPELPAGFAEHVVKNLRTERRPRPLLVAAWIAAVAAGLFIAAVPIIRGLNTQDPDHSAPVAEQQKEPPAPAKDKFVEDGRQEDDLIAAEFDLADTDLLKETTEFVKSMGSENLASVRPITSGFSSAMTLIRGTLPGGKSGEAKKNDSSSVASQPERPFV